MLGYGVILFVDYEKALCPLFPQYKGGQISLRLLNSPKSEDVLYVKEDKIFIQGLYQAIGINSEMRSRQKVI